MCKWVLFFVLSVFHLSASCRCTMMGFNIEDGGALVSLPQVIEIIRKVDPDIVCIQEAEGRLPYIAEQLGWPHYNRRMRVISHYPIIDPPEGKGVYVFVELEPGKVVAVSNVHLPSDPYGPYLLNEGKSEAYVERIERKVRLTALKKQLRALPELAASGVPVFLVGDFNAPSYLDEKRGFRWPVSHELELKGFRDSYREVHPDTKKNPGFTWWAARPQVPGWNPNPDDPHDRIDFIYVHGPVTTESSKTIGAKYFTPWPSDHRVVVSTCVVEPSDEPVFVSVDERLVNVGDMVHVRYNAPAVEGMRIALFLKEQQFFPKKIISKSSGKLEFKTKSLQPATYEVRLFTKNGKVLSSFPFTIKRCEDKPSLYISKDVFAYDEPIAVSWKHAPGHNLDWVGIMRADDKENLALMAAYTSSEIEGSYSFDRESQFSWPLEPGDYTLSYFLDDSKREITRVSFTVK